MQHPARLVLDAVAEQAFARLEQAAHEAATSPWNKRKPPTEAQARANNYFKGRFLLRPGLPIKIDNPRGTFRSGTSPDGTQWSNRMAAHYGDLTGTKGADGDAVDIFLGPFPESPRLWVINQRRTWGDRGFDEHKVMAGFLSEEQARAAYLGSYDRGWDGLESIVPCTYDQLKWWLRYGDTSDRFTTENLPYEGTATMDNAVQWDKDANPVGIPMHQLVYDLRRADAGAGLLLDAADMADLLSDPDIEGVVTLDALVVEVSRMTIKMEALRKVMDAVGTKVKPTEFQISDPVRARGVLQVMVLFQMDDGQTIAIWFHNPDTTPAKLTPLDELISWKWMLNKKDVTIVVAPERGQELNIREVARRVMRLVERNTDAFKRANERAAERLKQVSDLRAEISVLEVELSDWQRKIEVAQMEQAEAPTPKERWDSARGYAKALAIELRDEVAKAALSDRRIAATDGYGNALDILKLVEQFASGEVTTEEPERLRSLVDEHAVEIRAQLAEAMTQAAPPASAQEEPAAKAPAAGNADSVLAGLGVPPDVIAAMADDGGYEAIASNEALAVKWQDVLDSALQQRIVDVRNALREIGWKGAGTELSKDIEGSVYGLKHDVKQVGAGKNVVQVFWLANGQSITDTLTMKASEMAVHLDEAVRAGIQAAQEQIAQEPDAEPARAGAVAADAPGYHWAIYADGAGRDGKGAVGRWGSLASAKDALDNMDNGGGNFYGVDEKTEDLFWSFKAETAILAANGPVPEPEQEARLLDEARRWANKERDAYGWGWMVRNLPKWITLRTEISLPNAQELVRKWAGPEYGGPAGSSGAPADGDLTGRISGAPADPKHFEVPEAEEPVQSVQELLDKQKAEAQAADAAAAARAPTDAELEAAAEAGAEVRRLSRNLADPGTKDMVPRAHLATEDGRISIALWTDADVARAVRAVHDAEDMSRFKPFDPSTLKMPTAVQLGLNKAATPVLIVSDGDSKVVLDGWSNGHMLDLVGRPSVIQKALEKYVGDLATSGFARRVPVSKVERLETAAKSRNVKVEPIAHYHFEEVSNERGKPNLRIPRQSLVLESADGSTWVWLDERYVAYFWKTYKGCEFFADGPDASVAVRHHGKLVGIIMPRATRGDASILTRAKRSKAKAQAAQEPDALTPAHVDAAYQFAEATEAFKIAVAHSVNQTDYSAFATARAIDERAKALGLSIAWDVQSVVLDGVLPEFSPEDAMALFEGRAERVLDAVIEAAKPHLPPGTVLDFVGDMGAALVQLEIALHASTNNEPIWRAEGNIAQADLCARNIVELRNALHFLKAAGATYDDAGDAGGEMWETVVGTIKRGGEVIGRAVVADGDGKAMVYVGATGTQRVTYVSTVDGERRNAMWSDDDAGELIDWLVENLAHAQAQADAAIAAAQAAAAAPAPAPQEPAATGGGEPPAEPPAAPPVEAPEPEPVDPAVQAARERAAAGHVSEAMGRAALAEIGHFMPKFQRRFIESAMGGEEGQWFMDKMWELRELILNMPKVYEQDGKGGAAVAYLHYFKGSIDAWITERDFDLGEQAQAYGMQDIGHGPEMGYISIEELTQAGAELDLHWTPKTIGEIRGDHKADASEDDEDPNIGRTWRSPQGAREITGFKDGRYTTTVDGEPGLSIDPDEVDAEIRQDERDVAEFEKLASEQRAREAESAAGVPELEAAGYTRVGPGVEYVRTIPGDDGGELRFNVRQFGEVGAAKQYRVSLTATFGGGITGAGQDVGTFDTPAQALAAVEAELEKRNPTASPEAQDASMIEQQPAPAPDPSKDADRAYLQTLVDGTADYFDTGILERIEPMFEKYASDAEMMDLLTRAANAYSDAAAAAAKQALGN